MMGQPRQRPITRPRLSHTAVLARLVLPATTLIRGTLFTPHPDLRPLHPTPTATFPTLHPPLLFLTARMTRAPQQRLRLRL